MNKHVIRFAVDSAAMYVAGVSIGSAFGLLHGVAAMVCIGAYGCWCFRDGIAS